MPEVTDPNILARLNRAGGMVPVGPRDPAAIARERNINMQGARIPGQIRGDELTNQLTGRKIREGGGLGEKDQQFINDLRAQIGNVDQVIRDIRRAAQVVDRFKTSPTKAFKARVATPEQEKSGVLDQLGAGIFGGLVSDADKQDYQSLQALQNEFVLQKQIEQKGPQTESDALRMQLAGVSPGKYKPVNAKILGDAMLRAQLLQRKPGFYTKWAQKFGSINATDQNGKSVDDAWAVMTQNAARNYNGRGKQATPRSSPRVIDFNDLPE